MEPQTEVKLWMALFSAVTGMVATAVGFVWKVNSSIDRKVEKEMKPVHDSINRLERELDSREAASNMLAANVAQLSKDALQLSLEIKGLKEIIDLRFENFHHRET